MKIKNSLWPAAGLLVLLALALSSGGCGYAKGEMARLEVYVTDPYFDSVTFPQGHECKTLGGNGFTPSLVVRNIPPGANAIIMEYSDRDSQSMDNGGHGKIGYVIPKGAWQVSIPSVPANTFDLPENFYVVEPHRNQVPALGLVGAYLPPCTQTEGHRFYMTVKVVYDHLPKEIGQKTGPQCPPGYHVTSCDSFSQEEENNQKAAWEACRTAVLNSKHGDKFTEKEINDYCARYKAPGQDQTAGQAGDSPKAGQSAEKKEAASKSRDKDTGPADSKMAGATDQGEPEGQPQEKKQVGASTWGRMIKKPAGKKEAEKGAKPKDDTTAAPREDDKSKAAAEENPEPAYKTTAKLDRFKYNPQGATTEQKPRSYQDIDELVDDYRQKSCPTLITEDEKAKKKRTQPHTFKRPTLLGQKNIALGTVTYNRSGIPAPPEKDGSEKK